MAAGFLPLCVRLYDAFVQSLDYNELLSFAGLLENIIVDPQ